MSDPTIKTFIHSGGGGDMLYGLATMYNLGGGKIFINMDHQSKFYKSLLDQQPYIKEIVYGKPSKVDYDLDLFRKQPFNRFTLLECHAMAFNLKFDLTKPWLFNIEPKHVADIVINDTGKLRWEGITLDWEQLRDFETRAVYVGLPHEYSNFCRDRKYNIPRVEIEDALDFARIIKGAKLYIGNQSTGLALAEGMKTPRFADLYLGNSKQYPKGKNGHYKISKKLIRRYLNG
jgi:hypothetical protein